jgi:hypothetical protein
LENHWRMDARTAGDLSCEQVMRDFWAKANDEIPAPQIVRGDMLLMAHTAYHALRADNSLYPMASYSAESYALAVAHVTPEYTARPAPSGGIPAAKTLEPLFLLMVPAAMVEQIDSVVMGLPVVGYRPRAESGMTDEEVWDLLQEAATADEDGLIHPDAIDPRLLERTRGFQIALSTRESPSLLYTLVVHMTEDGDYADEVVYAEPTDSAEHLTVQAIRNGWRSDTPEIKQLYRRFFDAELRMLMQMANPLVQTTLVLKQLWDAETMVFTLPGPAEKWMIDNDYFTADTCEQFSAPPHRH